MRDALMSGTSNWYSDPHFFVSVYQKRHHVKNEFCKRVAADTKTEEIEMRKQSFFLVFAFTLLSLTAIAKKYPFQWQSIYEIEQVRVAQQGSKFVKVWGTAANADKAILQARQNAVAACIVSGVAATPTAGRIPPLCPDAQLLHQEYFKQFFTSGAFLDYAFNVNQQYPTGENNVSTPSGRKVGIYVEVKYDALRQQLERDGIVESLAQQSVAAQKPVVMVVPEKGWCVSQGYGTDLRHIDYGRALANSDILAAITKMGDLMAGRGYPMKQLQATLDELNNEATLDLALQSSHDGEIAEDMLDQLLRTAQADIVVNIAFSRISHGPRKYVEFRVSSVDAATQKQISGDIGSSSSSSAPIVTLLEESVLSFMDNFTDRIQQHFDDLLQNGREAQIVFKMATDSPLTFESQVSLNGETGSLAEAIDYWMSEHVLNSSYTLGSKSRVRLAFEQIRIPLKGKTGFGGRERGINAEDFVRPIRTFLAQFGLSVSTTPVGIGKVYVVLGKL